MARTHKVPYKQQRNRFTFTCRTAELPRLMQFAEILGVFFFGGATAESLQKGLQDCDYPVLTLTERKDS